MRNPNSEKPSGSDPIMKNQYRKERRQSIHGIIQCAINMYISTGGSFSSDLGLPTVTDQWG